MCLHLSIHNAKTLKNYGGTKANLIMRRGKGIACRRAISLILLFWQNGAKLVDGILQKLR